ncbi:hypothetical protein PRIPAC_90718 [Pristionchus pacificus]|nr:hypothetical protein PRIPAC_90718 [Pristionchus pacificus]
MEGGQLLAELEEKEDGELDSDQEGQEDQNYDKGSCSPNVHEEAIDKLLASCAPSQVSQAVAVPEERVLPNSLVSDHIIRKELDIPNTYRNRSADVNDDRVSWADKSTRLKNSNRRPKSAIVDVVTIDEELIEKNRLEKEIAAIDEELQTPMHSKEKELEKRQEKWDESAKKLEEKKARLAKSERGIMMKKGYISDMCKRRDDYVARVKRLIEDIDKQIMEEEEMKKETEKLRKEVDEDEVNLQKESNKIASAILEALSRVENEEEEDDDDDVSVEEVEEVMSDGNDEEDGLSFGQKKPVVTRSTSIEDHDEETLRNILLMQLQSKERSDEVEVGIESKVEKTNGDAIQGNASENERMEQEEMESDIGEISLEGSGMGSTMCPWDLNGICKDDECPFLHNRPLSRLDNPLEISA